MADQRILRLTKEEEKRLLLRLEQITSLQDLRHLEQRMYEQLGIRVRIEPGASEVRTVRGIQIEVLPMRRLCSKTRQAIPAAIRRGTERTPGVAFELLDEWGCLGENFGGWLGAGHGQERTFQLALVTQVNKGVRAPL